MQTNLPSTPSKGAEPQPFFEQLQHEIERLFDRFRGYPPVAGQGTTVGFGNGLSPAIDMAETDDKLDVTIEVPGVHADDLDVSLNGDQLVIKGEKSEEHTEENKNYHMHERSYGSFRRQIPLGFTPAEDAINATFTDGVLRLAITKPAEAKTVSRKIAISAK
jgi:HSP20 family protein